MIFTMERKHAKTVAELHCRYLNSLLTNLGKRITKMFYETAVACNGNFGYVYVEDGQLLGFVFATTDPSGLYRQIVKKKNVRLLIEILLTLSQNPHLLKKIASSFKGRNKNTYPELSYIAVDERRRGKGIGGALIDKLNEEFKLRNVHYYELSVDRDNIIARKFYESKSFMLRYEFIEHDLPRCRYFLKL